MTGIALVLLLAAPCAAAAQGQEQQVVAVVQRLFEAMARRDAEAARSLLTPGGSYVAVREDGTLAGGSHEEFAGRLAKGAGKLLERMWNPKVLVHDRVAVLWTEYDFHRDGKFSHCGVDAFNLVREAGGWRIASFSYTVRTAGCRPRPFGPPR